MHVLQKACPEVKASASHVFPAAFKSCLTQLPVDAEPGGSRAQLPRPFSQPQADTLSTPCPLKHLGKSELKLFWCKNNNNV